MNNNDNNHTESIIEESLIEESLIEEFQIIEEYNKQLANLYYLHNKLENKLKEKNSLISILSHDLINSKKEIEELNITIEFYKDKNINLKKYLEENNKKLKETNENLISEIKKLYEEKRAYEEFICTTIYSDSFTRFNEKNNNNYDNTNI